MRSLLQIARNLHGLPTASLTISPLPTSFLTFSHQPHPSQLLAPPHHQTCHHLLHSTTCLLFQPGHTPHTRTFSTNPGHPLYTTALTSLPKIPLTPTKPPDHSYPPLCNSPTPPATPSSSAYLKLFPTAYTGNLLPSLPLLQLRHHSTELRPQSIHHGTTHISVPLSPQILPPIARHTQHVAKPP